MLSGTRAAPWWSPSHRMPRAPCANPGAAPTPPSPPSPAPSPAPAVAALVALPLRAADLRLPQGAGTGRMPAPPPPPTGRQHPPCTQPRVDTGHQATSTCPWATPSPSRAGSPVATGSPPPPAHRSALRPRGHENHPWALSTPRLLQPQATCGATGMGTRAPSPDGTGDALQAPAPSLPAVWGWWCPKVSPGWAQSRVFAILPAGTGLPPRPCRSAPCQAPPGRPGPAPCT